MVLVSWRWAWTYQAEHLIISRKHSEGCMEIIGTAAKHTDESKRSEGDHQEPIVAKLKANYPLPWEAASRL